VRSRARPLASRIAFRGTPTGPVYHDGSAGRTRYGSAVSTGAAEYFDRLGQDWLGKAYPGGSLPAAYPLGERRIRAALEALEPGPGRDLVDLGCGGGQLCAHAAVLGSKVVGVDVAPAMVDAAQSLRETLDEEVAARIELRRGDAEGTGLPDASFDAAAALGLIEYLEADERLLREARRLLRPDGVLAVSCRNRLFNLASLNAYTEAELAGDDAPTLLAELRAALAVVAPDDLRALARELATAADELEAAAAADEDEPPAELFDHGKAFSSERRQHTPAQLERAARDAGFEPVSVVGVHPHPLPPALEHLAPRVYNRLALAWEHALGDSPLALASCTTFVSVFRAC